MVVFPALARPIIRARKRMLNLCACPCRPSISSAPGNWVLERDICRWDAGDGGSDEESRCGERGRVESHAAKGVTSLTHFIEHSS